jgi:DHA2 family multidrug resistance protein
MTVLAFATLPAQKIAEGSGVFTLVRNFGSSIYVSAIVVLLVRSTTANYARMTEFISPYNKALSYPGLPSAWSIDAASGLLRLSNEIQHQAAMIGYLNAFYLMAATAAAGVPLAWLMRPGPRGG